MSREIMLSKGMVAIVDDNDFIELSKYKWYCAASGYAFRSEWSKGKKKEISMHRQLMNFPYPLVVDHINQNRLDNRRCNLRVIPRYLNSANSNKQRKTYSKYKGIHKYKANGKWQAYIQVQNNTYHLGYFNTEKEAAIAYNKKALELLGEFACLNKID